MSVFATAAKTVSAIGVIGGGALALNELHVTKADFEQYLDSQETRYVLELKKEIREVRKSLREHPQDDYLNDQLIELLDALCEIRPADKLCKEGL